MKVINKITKNPTSISLVLITFYAFIAYFILIPFLGFYSDDFFFSYVGHFYGPEGIVNSLSIDRPFTGYCMAFIYSILKNNIILWHYYVFLIKLLGAYFLYFTVSKIWSKNKKVVTLITISFLIYPGFLQQALPLGYSTWITGMTLWIFSLYLTVYAIKINNNFSFIFFTLVSLFFQVFSFLVLEIFLGLEILRFSFIYLLANSHKFKKLSLKQILKTSSYSIPYLLGTIIFIFWRIFIFKSTRDITNVDWVIKSYYSNPFWVFKLPLELLISFVHTVIFSYFLPIAINLVRVPIIYSVISLTIGGLSILPVKRYIGNKVTTVDLKNLGKTLLLIGFFSIIGALIPTVLSGRSVREYLMYDRYTMTGSIGVALLLLGVVLYKFKSKLQKLIIITLIFISTTSHLLNNFYHIDNWNKQKNIWWQLYWRSPQIKNNAMLIFYFPEMVPQNPMITLMNKVKWYQIYWVDYQIWAPGNMLFNYNLAPEYHFRGDLVSNSDLLSKVKDESIEKIVNRNIYFQKDYTHPIIISTPNNFSCLQVLDKNHIVSSNNINSAVEPFINYSDADNLVKSISGELPPSDIFGKEPQKNWCYYFQKASLYRQKKDWQTVIYLWQKVIEKNFKPKDINEYLPFIEGLIVNSKYFEAENLINTIINQNKDAQSFIDNVCKLLDKTQEKEIKINCN